MRVMIRPASPSRILPVRTVFPLKCLNLNSAIERIEYDYPRV